MDMCSGAGCGWMMGGGIVLALLIAALLVLGILGLIKFLRKPK